MPFIVLVAAALISTAVEVGITMLLGGSSNYGPRLNNRAFSTSTYGAEIWRCLGTVRVPGNIIWSTAIQETIYDKQAGSWLSQSDNYSYWYSCSFAVGFARGPADKLLALWMDGKRIYSAKVANAHMSGTVTLLASGATPALQGDLVLNVRTESNATMSLEAGAIIQWPGDDTDYEVEQAISLGPNQYGQIQIWPPLYTSKLQNATMLIPGINSDWLNQDDWGPPDAAGALSGQGVPAVRFRRIETPQFYTGTATQAPDPVLQEYLGDNNVPAYRDLVYYVVDQLFLMNFGNRIPNITAEIAFKDTVDQFPINGPVVGAKSTNIAVPYSVEARYVARPGDSPFVVGVDSSAIPNVSLIASSTMQLQSTFQFPQQTTYPILVDTDGYIYAVFLTAGVTTLTKWDMLAGSQVDSIVISGYVNGIASMALFDNFDPFATASSPSTAIRFLSGGGGFAGATANSTSTSTSASAPTSTPLTGFIAGLRKYIGMVGTNGGTLVIERGVPWSTVTPMFYPWSI